MRRVAVPLPREAGATPTPAMPTMGTRRPLNHCPMGMWTMVAATPPPSRSTRRWASVASTFCCQPRESSGGMAKA